MAKFPEVWAIDTEWGFREGRLDQESAWEPVVFCAVGLRSGRRLFFWGRDHRLPGFIRDHAADLFVGHYAVAEMKYLLRMGVPLPPHWFDTFAAWRYRTNAPGKLEAGLSAALQQLGLPHLAPVTKNELREKIVTLGFDPNVENDRQEIIDYCLSDCDGCGALYPPLQHDVQPETMAHWAEYLKAVARMELRGLPFDVKTYDTLYSRQPEIRAGLLGDINREWPVFGPDGFNPRKFLSWCKRNDLP